MHTLLKFYVFLWKNKSVFFFFLTIIPLIGLLYLNNNQQRLTSKVEILNYDMSQVNISNYADFNAKIKIKNNMLESTVFANDVDVAKQNLQALNKEIIADISYDMLKKMKSDLKVQGLKVTSLLEKKQTLVDINERKNLTGTELKVYKDEIAIIEKLYQQELVKFQKDSLVFESFSFDNQSSISYIMPKDSKIIINLFICLFAGFVIALIIIALRNLTHKTFDDELEIKKQTGVKSFEGLPKLKKISFENNKLVSGKLKVNNLTEISRIFKYISSRDRKIFEVVSSIKGEGNSSLTQALAEHASYNNNKVLLIDLNLRNMDLSVNITKKLENWDISEKDFSSIDEKVVCLNSNLDFLPALKDEASLEVLKSTKNLKALIKYLNKKYDYIFFDTTAVFSVNIHNLDSVILAGVVDGVIINYLANKTPSKKLLEALENLRMVDSNILGVVTNNRYNPRLKEELLVFCSYLEKINKSMADSLRVKILKSSLLDEE